MRLSNAYFLATGFANMVLGQTPSAHDPAAISALQTCTGLQGTLGPDIVQFSGAEYLASASNAWSLFNTEDRPPCIVFPRNATHVQSAMAAIYRDKIRYAVQAGGHSAMTGWNTYVRPLLGVYFLTLLYF